MKNRALPQLWLRFDPWPRNFHMPWMQPLKKKKKNGGRKEGTEKREGRRIGGRKKERRPVSFVFFQSYTKPIPNIGVYFLKRRW